MKMKMNTKTNIINMKKKIIALLAFAFSITCNAQSAKDVLNNVMTTIKSYSDISAEFDYIMLNEDAGIDETMQGSLWSKGKAYKVKLDGQEMICDGTTTWTYISESNEVMISDADGESSNPLTILEEYYDKVNAKLLKTNDLTKISLEMTPRGDDDRFTKMRLDINAKTMQPQCVTITDGNGTDFICKIKKFEVNKQLDDKLFTFNAKQHPGVEIIDMR